MFVIINDSLIAAEDAAVSITDRGFLYGDALFETIPLYNGILFRLDQHLQRFFAGCRELGIEAPLKEDIVERLDRLLMANGLRDGILRFRLTRGTNMGALDPRHCRDSLFLANCTLPRPMLPSLWSEGAFVVTAGIRRIPPQCLPPTVKSGNYLSNILASREAAEAGAQEALMLTLDGAVAEGTVSNIFIVRGNTLLTPEIACGILPGIARDVVLEAAREIGLNTTETTLWPEDMLSADEAFYTNSLVAIAPIGQLDVHRYGPPGPVTQRLRDAVGRIIAAEAGPAWSFPAVFA